MQCNKKVSVGTNRWNKSRTVYSADNVAKMYWYSYTGMSGAVYYMMHRQTRPFSQSAQEHCTKVSVHASTVR